MNVYLQTEENEIETRIAAVRTLADGSVVIAAVANIVRPAGGGQPADAATIRTCWGEAPISRVFKEGGETWLEVDAPLATTLAAGSPVTLLIDPVRRRNLSRAHSLTHLVMAAVREHVSGYESKGADICEDAATVELRFRSSETIAEPLLRSIDRRARSLIAAALPIHIEKVKSIAHAEASFPKWRVDPDLALGGRIRVVHIEGIDSNPCSGSHVVSTREIGPYALLGHRLNGAGANILSLRRGEAWSYWL